MHSALYVHDRQRIQSLSTIKHFFKSYTALLGQGTLEPVDMLAIFRLLLLIMDRQPPGIKAAILRYIDVFAGHYVRKVLPPHSEASRDLMSLYRNIGKHENARRLWEWMVHQDHRYVSIKTYAEAIELAAASNQSLRICEELYDEALMRYTDKLISPILSPGFMLPPKLCDRDSVMIKPHLCLAIFYARICRGDWRTAHLNLDTAFRLWLSTIHCRFLKGLLKGRPVHEGYQVYALFCRAGAYVGGQELQMLLDAMARACEDSGDLGLKSDLTQAMLEAVRMFVKVKDARLDARHLNCLIRGFLSVLPHRGPISQQKDNKLDTVVSSFLCHLKEWFLKRGSNFDSTILATVISWSIILRDKSSFDWALNELRITDQCATARNLGAEYSSENSFLYSSLLSAAGEFRSPETVKVAWEFLVKCAARTRFGPQLADWGRFAAAARETGLVPYYNLQLELFVSKGKTGAYIARKADYVSRVRRNYPANQAVHAENPDVRIVSEAFVQGARATLGDFHSATSKGANNDSLIRYSIWHWPATVPEEWQRRLYDELSSKSSVELSAVPVLYKVWKPLSISSSDLRYRSWKTINNLLLQAEAF